MPIATFTTWIATTSTLNLEARMRFGTDVADRTGATSGIAMAFVPEEIGWDKSKIIEVWLGPTGTKVWVRYGLNDGGDLFTFEEVEGTLPAPLGTSPFVVKLEWSGAGAAVKINDATVALPALPQMPVASNGHTPVESRVLMDPRLNGREEVGFLDYIDLREIGASIFWTDLQLAREVV